MNNCNELLEKISEIKHEQWMEWAKSILLSENISEERKKRWEKFFVPYCELPEEEKEKDRFFAKKILEVIKKNNN